jgi:1,2-diacylglycerol-3-alpha-glucose alpha-1,2-glucosyltransferase
MKVRVYAGAIGVVEKSGIGRAIHHQMEEMERIGVQVTTKQEPEVKLVQLNTIFPDSAAAAFIARRRGEKVIWYGHSTEEDFRNSFHLSNTIAPLFRRWITWCYSQADAVITPTEYSRSILKGYGIKKPIYALSNGVDTEFFRADPSLRRSFRERYGLRDGEKAVISVGHMIERKGILDFLDLARRMPETRFIWFGYTSPALIPKKIRAAVKNAPSNVMFPGYVDKTLLKEAYCGCDLFCFMSHEETEGIVVLEALAAGTPTLLRDIPVYEPGLKDGENVYKADSPDEFYDKAEAILSGTLPDVTGSGRKTVERLSLRNVGYRLKTIQESVMRDGAAEN